MEPIPRILQSHAEEIKKLVDDLQLIARPTGDVTFSSMDRAKSVLSSLKDAKDATEKLKKVLKARAQERMKEG
jgi:ElaB/YqjD/DUF883 family membrane-anchored ribosome-binding protein